MNAAFEWAQMVLDEAGFSVSSVETPPALTFEDPSVLGFLMVYDTVDELLASYSRTSQVLLARHAFLLRSAGAKAWNTYMVLLATSSATSNQLVALSGIEEDLSGTRKIARAGVADREDVHAALLSLLSLQTAPRLGAVNMPEEIRLRTTELPANLVNAFLSGADDGLLMQIIDEEQP
ncbi:hypothetical protein [Cognatilysobacter lacus]|uniref:Uncharacterized protein n=1 Tax=Cognatilysobacter lacus TaxID=1643323 RepID=A0A5D8Z9H8_9GAMM|nr:hypothetical protein [Lysobacter lacus]TZF90772.1 hypothetical protein FW784_03980 [Lysobacter lacus]